MKHWCVFMVMLLSAFNALSSTKTDSLIRTLHQAIENKGVYVQTKLHHIERLKGKLPDIESLSPRSQFDVYNNLYHAYKTFIYDSAFKYAGRLIGTAYRLQDKSMIGYARVKLGFILVSSGMFKETFDSLKVVDVKTLADSTTIEYYTLMARAFYDLAVYDHDNYYNASYTDLGNQYMDSAKNLCQPGTYHYLYLSGLKNLKTQNVNGALSDLSQVLGRFTLTYPRQAVNDHNLSYVYNILGQTDKAIEFMVRAAIADIKAATKETAAMYTLAKLLYEKGDIVNAYIFIEQAMEDALYYGARQRKVEIGSILPLIASKKLNNVEEQRRLWLMYSFALTVLAILVSVFAFIIIKQLKKLKAAELKINETNQRLQETNKKLREANKIKEEYIGYYFNINSEYINKMEELKRDVDRKLLAKKTEDIKFIIDSINLKREREALYLSFDKVFLKLFPDFVSAFNSYFTPGDRFVLRDGQLLNTELRIFALIRMGINDTEKIAKILDYSVNTIYAYKTRVKSKSLVPNEQFEKRIMEIKTV